MCLVNHHGDHHCGGENTTGGGDCSYGDWLPRRPDLRDLSLTRYPVDADPDRIGLDDIPSINPFSYAILFLS